MRRFLLRRLGFMVFTLFVVSVAIFAVTQLLPGDVATAILGQQATPEDLATLRERLGLNRPAHVRYVEWLGGALRGDWGSSLRLGVPIGPLMLQRLERSLALAGFAFALGVPLAIGLGVVAGIYRDRLPDHAISIGSLLAVSAPEFVSGAVLIVVFSSWLRLLPPSSLIEPGANLVQSARYLVLPALTLMLVMLAHTARMTRASMVEVLGSNYIRTAILKGLPWGEVILRLALKNALLPTITIVAINVGWLIGGLIVVETVFGYPGLGRLLIDAIENRDLPLLQAIALLIAFVYAVSNLVADLLYARLNPRIRYS
ncbi:MAG: ABC transporter permease [Chloroflexi bacterium]|nr:ABC transporter permease [Chloroflexota bacterium]